MAKNESKPEKPWYTSTTLWINVGGVIAVALLEFVIDNSIIEGDHLAMALLVLNALRRFQGGPTKLTR